MHTETYQLISASTSLALTVYVVIAMIKLFMGKYHDSDS